MLLKKFSLLALASTAISAVPLTASEESPAVAIVNFTTCITESKYGQKEQENFEGIRKQLSSMIEDTETELKDISSKFEDTEYLDSLSPKAEEEMKTRYQALNEDLARYQGQFYQIMQQANMQLVQKMNTQIAKASEKIAKEKNLAYVINKDACFYYNPELDMTSNIVNLMDQDYEIDARSQKISDNQEDMPSQAMEDSSTARAG